MQELIDKVVQWGNDRNLTAPDNLVPQTLKLVSEFGEIGAAIVANDDREIIDGLGDVFVVAIIIGEQIGISLTPDQFPKRDEWWEPAGVGYERTSGKLGLFVDAVLKKNPAFELHGLLCDFVEQVCYMMEDWNIRPDLPMDPEKWLQAAYDEIKDRKGVMYHGAFIKESDPRYEAVMSNLRIEKRAGAA
jgi:NTP pyrophosphatase (non-canonical NTP hydrolase)